MLPRDVREPSAPSVVMRVARRLLICGVLLVLSASFYLTTEIRALESAVQAGEERITALTSHVGTLQHSIAATEPRPPQDSDLTVFSGEPLVYTWLDRLDDSVPADVWLTSLTFSLAPGVGPLLQAGTASEQSPQSIRIEGLAQNGAGIGSLIRAMENLGYGGSVELENFHQQGDGDVAFSILVKRTL